MKLVLTSQVQLDRMDATTPVWWRVLYKPPSTQRLLDLGTAKLILEPALTQYAHWTHVRPTR